MPGINILSRMNRLWLLALLAMIASISTAAIAEEVSAQERLKALESQTKAVVENCVEATVGIMITKAPGMAAAGGAGMGTGVIVSEDGLVLTAGHVIAEPGTELTLILSDGRRVKAKALGVDRAADAGMAQIIDKGPFDYAPVAEEDSVKAKDWCIATGHSGGIQLDRTPPVRIGRVLQIKESHQLGIGGMTTDCTVISGDSGGPLFNLKGEVIGIHSNIGLQVTQNRHVSIDAYHEKWDRLAGGEMIGGNAAVAQQMQGVGGPEMQKMVAELQRRIQQGDPKILEMMKKNGGNNGVMMITPEMLKELASGQDADGKKEKDEKQQAQDEDAPAPQPHTQPEAEQPSDTDNQKDSEPADDEASNQSSKSALPDHIREQVLAQLRQQFAGLDEEALNKMLESAQFDGGNQMRLHLKPEDLGQLGDLAKLGLPGMELPDTGNGKAHDSIMSLFQPVVDQAKGWIAQVLCNDKSTILGTVVSTDGHILTKASELTETIQVKLAGTTFAAQVVATDDDYDLALLKIDAEDLTPVRWAKQKIGNGDWLVTPSHDGKPLGMGVVSVLPRPIADRIQSIGNGNRAILGVVCKPDGQGAAHIQQVSPDSPASAAGIQPDDQVVQIEDHQIKNHQELIKVIGLYTPGEKIEIEVLRGEERKILHATLEDAKKSGAFAMPSSPAAGLSKMAGEISERNMGFPMALQHDCVIWASDCGGPVMNLDGDAVGLNIARFGRTATYAIPADVIVPVIDRMLKK